MVDIKGMLLKPTKYVVVTQWLACPAAINVDREVMGATPVSGTLVFLLC